MGWPWATAGEMHVYLWIDRGGASDERAPERAACSLAVRREPRREAQERVRSCCGELLLRRVREEPLASLCAMERAGPEGPGWRLS